MASQKPGLGFRLAQCLLMLITLAVSLVIVDIAVQKQMHVPSNILKDIIRYEPDLLPSKRLKPNLDIVLTGELNEFTFRLTTTEDGFRTSYPLPSSEPKKYDLLFLGDSQTAGVGMEDEKTFASLTGKALGKTVLNTGCFGYSTIEQWQMARTILKTQKPQLAVLFFYAGNDPYENFVHRLELTEEPIPAAASVSKKLPPLDAVKDWLKRRSSLYNLLGRLRSKDSVNQLLYRLRLVKGTLPRELEVYRKEESADQKNFMEITEKTFLKLKDELAAHNVPLLVVSVPDRCYIDTGYWEAWIKKYNLEASDFDLLKPSNRMRDFCAANQILFLDLNPVFKEKALAGEKGLYWKMDLHLAAEGNRLTAETVSDYIKKNFPLN